jgi:RNA polymerase sigma-70 factor (ECF subfamily)
LAPDRDYTEDDLPEAPLLEALRRQDGPAQEALVRAYLQRLLATAWHFLGHQDPDAEDVVQETLLAAFKGMDGFEGRSGLYTWLNHICVNQCFSLLRKRRRALATETEDLERLLAPASLDRQAQEAEQARLARRQELLKGWIGAMGAPCQRILQLRFLDGHSLAEIKDRLKVPQGTVASRLRRCQASLIEKARA